MRQVLIALMLGIFSTGYAAEISDKNESSNNEQQVQDRKDGWSPEDRARDVVLGGD